MRNESGTTVNMVIMDEQAAPDRTESMEEDSLQRHADDKPAAPPTPPAPPPPPPAPPPPAPPAPPPPAPAAPVTSARASAAARTSGGDNSRRDSARSPDDPSKGGGGGGDSARLSRVSQAAGKDATRARASTADKADKKPAGLAGRFIPNFISTALAPVLGGANHNPHGHALLPASSSEMAGYLYKQVPHAPPPRRPVPARARLSHHNHGRTSPRRAPRSERGSGATFCCMAR